MTSARTASVGTQRIGIGVVVALVAVFALRVGSSSSQSVLFRDLTVWLPSTSTGEVVLVHAGSGSRGEVVARVKAANAREQLVVAQSGSGAVVLNRTTGEVGQIDGVTLTLSQRAPLLGIDERSRLLWSDAGARVVTADAVHRLDRVSGIPTGSVPLRSPLSDVVTDAAGTIYGRTDTGQVVAVAGDVSTVPLPDTVEPVGLVSAGGRAYVIDRSLPALHRLDTAKLRGRSCLTGAIAAGVSLVSGGSTSAGAEIAVVVDSAGGVRISDTGRGSCASLALNLPALNPPVPVVFGVPVVAGGFVYLPLLTSGEIIVVNALEAAPVNRYSLGLPAGRPFDLVDQDGTVWFNDPAGTLAGVLGRDGVSLRVDKTARLTVGAIGQGSSGGRGAVAANSSGSGGTSGASTTGSSGAPVSGATGRSGASAGTGTEGTVGSKGSASRGATSIDPSSDPTNLPSTPAERLGLVADFTYTARSVKIGQPVVFTDTSSGQPTAWTWEFGDGTFATGPKSTHTWNQAGIFTVALRVENATASATASVAITVLADATRARPEADFRFNAARVEVGQPITFTDRSAGDPIEWQWSFGDGSGGSGPTITHAYRAAGTYQVTVTVANQAGSSTSPPALITVFDKVESPVAAIGGGLATTSVGQLVSYFSRSSGNATQLQWNFGDGSSANGPVVQHAWSKSGSYLVTLVVSNSAGSSTATAAIMVNEIVAVPVSRFVVSQNTAEDGQALRFQSLSTNNPTQLAWDFGDGTSARGTSVTHPFGRPGSYAVSLLATNAAGSDVSTQQITIVAQLPAPVAGFSFAPNTVTSNTPVVFIDESSGGAATSWSWDFGDGSPAVTQRNPTHFFDRVGTYVVRLSVTNARGVSVAQRTVAVLPAPPEPAFTFSPAVPMAGSAVQFADSSGGGPVTSWLWNFGDGATSTQRNPSHTFAGNGSYDVRMTVTNVSGAPFVVRRVDVNPPAPVALFEFTPTAPTTATPVVFRNTSTGGAASTVRWDFGDGTPNSTAPSPSHSYATQGGYTVRLTMGNVTATSTSVATVNVTVPPPVASFQSSAPAVAGRAVSFTDTSAGGPFTSVTWDFGDGSPASTASNPSHVFAAAGLYNVRLTVANGGGSVSATVRISVVPPITAEFTASNPRIALQAITFTNTTTGGPFTSLTWDFGDGATGSGAAVTHSFATLGTYSVSLTAVASTGATSEVVNSVAVAVQAPAAAFNYAAASSPARTVTFTNTSAGAPFTSIVWDFGDGSAGTGATSTHTFGAGASFDVMVTVTNATGTSSTTRRVSMATPVANFTFVAGAAPRSFVFTSTSTGGPFTSVAWGFGDGSSGSGASIAHIFAIPGSYVVTLVVANGLGVASTPHTVVVT